MRTIVALLIFTALFALEALIQRRRSYASLHAFVLAGRLAAAISVGALALVGSFARASIAAAEMAEYTRRLNQMLAEPPIEEHR